MKLKLTFKAVFAFLALLFICHEIHELAHTGLAYFQCGCWGKRDFNVWSICETCPPGVNTIWATLAGPVVTYLMIWVGWWLLSGRQSPERKSVGFVLIWANVPLARFITIAMKGGDEGVVARAIYDQNKINTTVWILVMAIILLLILLPLIRAFTTLSLRKRIPVFLSFLIMPMLVEYILMHKLGGTLLKQDILAQEFILGSPALVILWNAIWLTVLLFTFPSLKQVLAKE